MLLNSGKIAQTIAALLVLAMASLQPPVYAQAQAQTTTSKANVTPPGPPRANPTPVKYETLKEPPKELPLPTMGASAQFIFGLRSHSAKSTDIYMRYGTSGSEQDVLGFYSQSLKSSGWSVVPASGKTIRAVQKGQSVIISLMPKSKPQYNTDFSVKYQYQN